MGGDEGFDEPALMLNGIAGVDDPDNFFPVGDATEWHEFWINLEFDPEAEEGTHKVTLYHNGSLEPVEFEVTNTGGQEISGVAKLYLFSGNPGTARTSAYDLDFFHVVEGVILPELVRGGGVPFQVTEISYDGTTDQSTLSWPSRANQSFIVESSENLELWLELADSIPSGGDATTFVDLTIAETDKVRYYQVAPE